jgi:uncharacterized protein (DUF433 family)
MLELEVTMSEQLEQAEQLLSSLSQDEKSQVLRWLLQELSDLTPGIEVHPNVCGGEPCIIRTRIPVWVLEQARRLGKSESELLAAYPTLGGEDLKNAWAYIRKHREEVEKQITENEAA